jgi:hypothetical protein
MGKRRTKHRRSWVELRKGTAFMTDKELHEAREDARRILDHLEGEIYKLNHPEALNEILYGAVFLGN